MISQALAPHASRSLQWTALRQVCACVFVLLSPCPLHGTRLTLTHSSAFGRTGAWGPICQPVSLYRRGEEASSRFVAQNTDTGWFGINIVHYLSPQPQYHFINLFHTHTPSRERLLRSGDGLCGLRFTAHWSLSVDAFQDPSRSICFTICCE